MVFVAIRGECGLRAGQLRRQKEALAVCTKTGTTLHFPNAAVVDCFTQELADRGGQYLGAFADVFKEFAVRKFSPFSHQASLQ